MKSLILVVTTLFLVQNSFAQRYKKLDDLTEQFIVLLNEGHDFPAFEHTSDRFYFRCRKSK